jgi:hypothetical protein
MSSNTSPASLSPPARVLLSLFLPLAGRLLFALIVGSSLQGGGSQGSAALQLAGAGLVAWFVGLRWYGIGGLGLRGHRALFAGIGFAVLAWVAFFAIRFATVESVSIGAPDSGRTFIYLLLFEAFCVQLWAFGLFFRSVADWRGPLAAAAGSGILFGVVALLSFQESFIFSAPSLLYFLLWGILYGVIRLRTGSLLGTTLIQALHSWTAWQIWVPAEKPDPSELQALYLVSSLFFLIIIWRLWPKREEDYRV